MKLPSPSPAMAVEPLSVSPILSSTPPYITAPSTPKLVPPPHSEFQLRDSAHSFVPFNWENNPGKSKSFPDPGAGDTKEDDSEEIAFEFCVDRFESFSLPAEELFDEGKIKPLKPPPRLQIGTGSELADSPAVIGGRRRKTASWSARRSYDFSDPFEAAIETARKNHGPLCESESSKTVSFDGSKRFSRLRYLFPFRRASQDSKVDSGFGSTGSSSSGSVHEPEAVKRIRCLTPSRRCLLLCFMKRS